MSVEEKWSYSRLATYESCPAKYKFSYIQGRRTESGPAAQRGTNIHAGVEDFLNGKAEDVPEEAALFKPYIMEAKDASAHVELRMAVDKNWSAVPYAEGWGRCIIDSVAVAGGVDVYEWKSGKIYDDHADQRKLYLAFAALHWPGKDYYRAKTYYFDQRKITELTITEEHVPEVVEEFDRRVDFMFSDDVLAPRPGWYCRFCGHSKFKGGPCRAG